MGAGFLSCTHDFEQDIKGLHSKVAHEIGN